MEASATAITPRVAGSPGRAIGRRLDRGAVPVWLLSGGLVLYLGIEGGGYDLVVRNRVWLLLWWILLLGCLFGLLPAARLARGATAALALLGGFVAWTALGLTWTISSERTLADVS